MTINNEKKIEFTIEERGRRYGDYLEQSTLCRKLRETMAASAQWVNLEPDMEDALIMISVKISRILNGDPYYEDSWRDIAGYAQLIANNLEGIE